jgi:multidrug resistance protein, MATE family
MRLIGLLNYIYTLKMKTLTLLFSLFLMCPLSVWGQSADDKEVIAVADTYFYWALAVPAVGIAAFIWDGIFIGATATRGMLLSMAAAAVSFFILYYGLHPVLANHALWLAFLTYLLMRGVVQTGLSREVIRRAFPSKKEPAWREG